MAEFTLVQEGDNLHDAINRVLLRDSGAARYGTAIHWTDFDGNTRDRRTGAIIDTSVPTLTIENGSGEHILVRKSTDSSTVFEVQDSGVTFSTLNPAGGAVALGGGLLVAGSATFQNNVGIQGALSTQSTTTLGNANTDVTTVTGPLVMQDWTWTLDGDDLVAKDDAGTEILRIGDTASTWHLKVTGPLWATGKILTDGELEVTGGPITPDALVGTPAAHGLYRGNVPKAWGNVSGSGTGINGSFNVSSVVDGGGAGHTINLDRDMASGSYAVVVTPIYTPGGSAATTITVMVDAIAAGSFIIYCHRVSDGAHLDPTGYSFACFGNQ